jgi:peptidoglycan/LPS O-acetylase OafA/YrhL
VIAGWLVRIACRQRFLVLSNAALVGLGHVSYSLYLWHWPLLIEATGRFGRSVTVITGALIATAACTALTYVFVEKPFMNGPARDRIPEFAPSFAGVRGM